MSRFADLLPALPAEDYDALKADIAVRGVQVPVVVDEHGVIIDGAHRDRAARELGVDCPRVVREGLDDDAKQALAISLNVHRRQLTRESRAALINALRRLGMSTRRIADTLNIPKTTVHRTLSSGVPDGTPEEVSPVIGKDNKTYPAARPPVSAQHEQADTTEPLMLATTPPQDPPTATTPANGEDEWPPPGWVPPADRVKQMPSIMGGRAIEQLYGFLAIVKKAGGPAAIVADEVPGLAGMSNPLNWHALRDARDVIDEWMRLLEDTTRLRRVK